MDLSLPGLEEGRLRRAPYVVSFWGGENVLYLQGRWLLNTVNVLNVANVTKKKKKSHEIIDKHNADDSQRHDSEGKKPDSQGHVLCDSI